MQQNVGHSTQSESEWHGWGGVYLRAHYFWSICPRLRQPPKQEFLSPPQATGLRSTTSPGLVSLKTGLKTSLLLFFSVFLLKVGLQFDTDAGVAAPQSLEEEVCVFF